LILPLLAIIAIVLCLQTKGRPFFRQTRSGWKEEPFDLIKFKTMTDDTGPDGRLLPKHMRVSKTGAFLRRYSLDELPQLYNVLRGDLSLVGPRPLLFRYLPLYSAEQRRRHSVRPGITGWAQVNGRNAISWTRKFELDAYYVDHLSFSLDIKILFMTVLRVLGSRGVTTTRRVTMSPFDGKN
jgi:undecaprenyl phosphate N,N'-diacetylbacillosamine 1-phosphate transferase